MKTETFVRYDYGPEKNKEKYGQESPPLIDLSKIHSVPIALLCGKTDVIVPIQDSHWTRDHLNKDVIAFYKEYDYGHITFCTGKDMNYIEDVDRLLRQYSKS